LKAQIEFNTVVVGDINAPLPPIDRSFKQNINKAILELNDTIDRMDLTYVYRIYHPPTAQYTFYSAAHRIFSKIDHILGHKGRFSTYNKTEITPCILSDHNELKLELNNKSNNRKYANNWRLNNTLLHDHWVTKKMRGNQVSWILMKMKTPLTRTDGTQQRQS
jgi:hypothetical protein